MKAVVAAVLLLVTAGAPAAEPLGHQITVKGEGKVAVPPDYVSLEMMVSADGQNVEALKAEVDAKTARLLAVAAKFQIGAADVKSDGMTVDKVYETDRNDNDVFKGHIVTRTLTLQLRKFSEYEALAHELIEAGADRLTGLTAGVDDEAKLHKPALAAAAQDARVKAQAIAESLGIRVGPPIEAGENRLWHDESLVQTAAKGYDEIVVTGSRIRSRPLPVLFTPQDVEVEATVWVRFAIEPAKP